MLPHLLFYFLLYTVFRKNQHSNTIHSHFNVCFCCYDKNHPIYTMVNWVTSHNSYFIFLSFQKICKCCTNSFGKNSVQKLSQMDNWLFANCCSQSSYKIGKSPNHTGLSFVCIFTFSVFGYRISVENIEYLFVFVKIHLLWTEQKDRELLNSCIF